MLQHEGIHCPAPRPQSLAAAGSGAIADGVSAPCAEGVTPVAAAPAVAAPALRKIRRPTFSSNTYVPVVFIASSSQQVVDVRFGAERFLEAHRSALAKGASRPRSADR